MKKLLIILSIILISCTSNQRARHFGGDEEIKLEKNEKFINITWKETNLWLITLDTTTNIYYAREKSSYGIWEGKITIK